MSEGNRLWAAALTSTTAARGYNASYILVAVFWPVFPMLLQLSWVLGAHGLASFHLLSLQLCPLQSVATTHGYLPMKHLPSHPQCLALTPLCNT